MNHKRLVAASAAAIVMAVTPGCKDVPLLPKWNAAEVLPLATQKIGLAPPFPAGVPVPGGTSQNVSFAPQTQQMNGLIGQVLQAGLVDAGVSMVITKSVAVSGNDTLFIADTPANLTNAASSRIFVPILISAAPNSHDSTLAIVSASGLTMLQNIANSGGLLYVQMRGQATCPLPGPCTFVIGDSVSIRLVLVATVPISR